MKKWSFVDFQKRNERTKADRRITNHPTFQAHLGLLGKTAIDPTCSTVLEDAELYYFSHSPIFFRLLRKKQSFRDTKMQKKKKCDSHPKRLVAGPNGFSSSADALLQVAARGLVLGRSFRGGLKPDSEEKPTMSCAKKKRCLRALFVRKGKRWCP